VADDATDPRARRLAADLAAFCDALEGELDATESAPPPELRERLLWRIRGEEQVEPLAPASAGTVLAAPLMAPDRGLATMIWALGVAASFMLAAAFGALWYATRADLGATRANVAQLEGIVHARELELHEKENELAWLKDPRVQVALLKGLEGNPSAKARLLWNPEARQGILWVSGLPPLPLEKSYELWAFVGEQPVPAGIFDAKESGVTVIPISKQDNLGDAPVKFAVSIEPRGGVNAPTGAIVLVGDRF
jgi:hypothetical protein